MQSGLFYIVNLGGTAGTPVLFFIWDWEFFYFKI